MKIIPGPTPVFCPFCGHSTKVDVCDEQGGTVSGFSVYCVACDDHGPVVGSDHFAIVCWNRMGGE